MALVAIGRNVAALNHVMIAETGEGIRFGVGAHCGLAVVGEIGHGATRVFTTWATPPTSRRDWNDYERNLPARR